MNGDDPVEVEFCVICELHGVSPSEARTAADDEQERLPSAPLSACGCALRGATWSWLVRGPMD